MKATVNVSDIKDVAARAARVASASYTAPVLGFCLVCAENGKVTIKATDLELIYIADISAEVEEEGRCLLPAAHFKKILSKLSGKLTISVWKDGSVVSCGRFKTRFTCGPVEDFPQLPERQPDVWVDSEKIRNAFSRVIHAVLKDEWNPTLSGVCMRKINDSIFACATDGRRLAMVPVAIPELDSLRDWEHGPDLIIPPSAVRLVLQITKKAQSVGIGVDSEDISFTTTNGESVQARRIIGKFPDLESVLFDPVYTVEAGGELMQRLRQASLAALADAVSLEFADGKLHVCAAKADIEYKSTLSVTSKGAGPQEPILLNVHFFTQALQQAGEGAFLGMADDSDKPVMIFGNEYKELIMPMTEE